MINTTSILYISLLFITGSLSIGCQSSEQKNEVAEENLNEQQENEDLAYVKAATAEELKTFKLESEAKIKNNEVAISELKLKMNTSENLQDKIYNKKIDTLEIRIKNMKTKMGNYELTHIDWTKFKEDFDRDLYDVAFRLKELVKGDKTDY